MASSEVLSTAGMSPLSFGMTLEEVLRNPQIHVPTSLRANMGTPQAGRLWRGTGYHIQPSGHPWLWGTLSLSSSLSAHFLSCWLLSILSCHHCAYFPRSTLPTAASGAHTWRRAYLPLCLGSPHPSSKPLF